MNEKFKKFIVFLYFVSATIFVTYPLIFHLGDYTFEYGDSLLITGIINWNIHSFFHDPFHVFDAPIYYPYKNTLAYSDTHFIGSLLGFLPLLLMREPMVAYNTSILLSLIMLGYFTFLLVYYFTSTPTAGVISGSLVAYSTFTLQRLIHPQVIAIQWIPLFLYFFFTFLKQKKYKYLFLANFFFIIQVLNSFLPAYFIMCLVFTTIVYYFFLKKEELKLFFNKKVLFLIVFNVLFLCMLTFPYYSVSHQFNYVRDIRDTINFANRPEFFLYPNSSTRLQAFLLNTIYTGRYKLIYDGYLGLVLTISSLFCIGYKLIKKRLKNKNEYFSIFFYTGVTAFVLSLGPVFQWGGKVIKEPFMIPLPYALLYYIVPGFKGIRNSARWEMLGVFAFSVVAGILFSSIMKSYTLRIRLIITIFICTLILVEFPVPRKYLQIETIDQFPQVYHFVKTLPKDAVILELPFYNWNMTPFAVIESKRIYYSTLHNKKRMNGGSGFSPPQWQEKTMEFRSNFPDDKTISYLKKIKVTHLILHKQEYEAMEKIYISQRDDKIMFWKDIVKNLRKYPEIKFVKQFGLDYFYEIKYKKS